MRRLLPPGLALLLTLVIWEAGVRLGNVPAYLLPPPSAIVMRIASGWQQISLHFSVTLAETSFAWIFRR